MQKIYLYNQKMKEELLGEVGEYDDEKYDHGYIVKIKRRMPLGTILSDAISVDFDFLKELVQCGDIEGLRLELGDELDCFSIPDYSLDDIIVDINALYLLKGFVDICNEHPLLCSVDFFYRFLDEAGLSAVYDMPELTGDYAHFDDLAFDDFCVGSNVSFSERTERIDLYTLDFNRNIVALKNMLLAPDPFLTTLEQYVEVWEASSLFQTVFTSLLTIIGEKNVVKKCSLCGKYFVPLNRSDAIYCDRVSPNDPHRTCKEYGSQKLWYDRLKNNEVAKLARNIYSAKQMLVKRNPDIVGYKKMFEYFKQERKRWEELVKSGEKSKEEYTAWLNEMKTKKTL